MPFKPPVDSASPQTTQGATSLDPVQPLQGTIAAASGQQKDDLRSALQNSDINRIIQAGDFTKLESLLANSSPAQMAAAKKAIEQYLTQNRDALFRSTGATPEQIQDLERLGLGPLAALAYLASAQKVQQMQDLFRKQEESLRLSRQGVLKNIKQNYKNLDHGFNLLDHGTDEAIKRDIENDTRLEKELAAQSVALKRAHQEALQQMNEARLKEAKAVDALWKGEATAGLKLLEEAGADTAKVNAMIKNNHDHLLPKKEIWRWQAESTAIRDSLDNTVLILGYGHTGVRIARTATAVVGGALAVTFAGVPCALVAALYVTAAMLPGTALQAVIEANDGKSAGEAVRDAAIEALSNFLAAFGGATIGPALRQNWLALKMFPSLIKWQMGKLIGPVITFKLAPLIVGFTSLLASQVKKGTDVLQDPDKKQQIDGPPRKKQNQLAPSANPEIPPKKGPDLDAAAPKVDDKDKDDLLKKGKPTDGAFEPQKANGNPAAIPPVTSVVQPPVSSPSAGEHPFIEPSAMQPPLPQPPSGEPQRGRAPPYNNEPLPLQTSPRPTLAGPLSPSSKPEQGTQNLVGPQRGDTTASSADPLNMEPADSALIGSTGALQVPGTKPAPPLTEAPEGGFTQDQEPKNSAGKQTDKPVLALSTTPPLAKDTRLEPSTAQTTQNQLRQPALDTAALTQGALKAKLSDLSTSVQGAPNLLNQGISGEELSIQQRLAQLGTHSLVNSIEAKTDSLPKSAALTTKNIASLQSAGAQKAVEQEQIQRRAKIVAKADFETARYLKLRLEDEKTFRLLNDSHSTVDDLPAKKEKQALIYGTALETAEDRLACRMKEIRAEIRNVLETSKAAAAANQETVDRAQKTSLSIAATREETTKEKLQQQFTLMASTTTVQQLEAINGMHTASQKTLLDIKEAREEAVKERQNDLPPSSVTLHQSAALLERATSDTMAQRHAPSAPAPWSWRGETHQVEQQAERTAARLHNETGSANPNKGIATAHASSGNIAVCDLGQQGLRSLGTNELPRVNTVSEVWQSNLRLVETFISSNFDTAWSTSIEDLLERETEQLAEKRRKKKAAEKRRARKRLKKEEIEKRIKVLLQQLMEAAKQKQEKEMQLLLTEAIVEVAEENETETEAETKGKAKSNHGSKTESAGMTKADLYRRLMEGVAKIEEENDRTTQTEPAVSRAQIFRKLSKKAR